MLALSSFDARPSPPGAAACPQDGTAGPPNFRLLLLCTNRLLPGAKPPRVLLGRRNTRGTGAWGLLLPLLPLSSPLSTSFCWSAASRLWRASASSLPSCRLVCTMRSYFEASENLCDAAGTQGEEERAELLASLDQLLVAIVSGPPTLDLFVQLST